MFAGVLRSSYLAQIIEIFCEIKSIIAVTREPVTVRLDWTGTGRSLLQLSNRVKVIIFLRAVRLRMRAHRFIAMERDVSFASVLVKF